MLTRLPAAPTRESAWRISTRYEHGPGSRHWTSTGLSILRLSPPLTAIGIFGVLSYSVARRTHEIGVRMALGADRSHVLGLTMAMGGKLVLTGLGLGLAGSLLLGRYLQSEVFSVPVTDPITIAAAVMLLAATAFVACLLPARRATRLEPMSALRHD